MKRVGIGPWVMMGVVVAAGGAFGGWWWWQMDRAEREGAAEIAEVKAALTQKKEAAAREAARVEDVPLIKGTLQKPAVRTLPAALTPMVEGPEGQVWCAERLPESRKPITVQEAEEMMRSEYRAKEPRMLGAFPILMEKTGRIWCSVGATLIGYDGKEFTEHGLKEDLIKENVWEDLSGRKRAVSVGGSVFFARREGVEAFDGKNWTAEDVGAAKVWLLPEPDGKGLAAVSENLVEIKRWRKERTGDSPAGWSEVNLTEGQEVRGNPVAKAVGATQKGVWILMPRTLYYAPYGGARTVKVGANEKELDVGSYHIKDPLWMLTLADGSLALVVGDCVEAGAEGVGNKAHVKWTGLNAGLPIKVLRIDGRDETVQVMGGEELAGRILGRKGKSTYVGSGFTTFLETPDGKGLWVTPKDTLRPVLLDRQTLAVIGETKFPLTGPPFAAFSDGTLVTRGLTAVEYNPYALDTREPLRAKLSVRVMGTVERTADGTIWTVDQRRNGRGFDVAFAWFDGKQMKEAGEKQQATETGKIECGLHAILFTLKNSCLLVTKQEIIKASSKEEMIEKNREVFAREFVGNGKEFEALECDAKGNVWMVSYKPLANGASDGSLKVYSNGKWVDPTEDITGETAGDNPHLLSIKPVGDRSHMYIRVVDGMQQAKAYWATFDNGELSVAAAPILESTWTAREGPVRTPDGSLWLVTGTGRGGAVINSVRGGVVTTTVKTSRLAGDGTLKEEIAGVTPMMVDGAGDLWVRKADTRNGAFAVYRDGKLTDDLAGLNLSGTTAFYAGGGTRVYAVAGTKIQELKQANDSAGKFVVGREFLPEMPLKGLDFARGSEAFYVVVQDGQEKVLTVLPVPD